MVRIDTKYTILDNAWLWRADHEVGGGSNEPAGGVPVSNSRNPVATGLIVNADYVRAYALMSEHTLGDLVQWNGNFGETYFFQSELPYDVTQAAYSDYCGYRLGPEVYNHKGYGIGVYSFFRDHSVFVNSGIVVTNTTQTADSNISFTNSLTVFLSGNGGQNHVVND